MSFFHFFAVVFGFIWNDIFFHPILNILVLLYKVSGGNFGIAVILITVLFRLALWPMQAGQIKASRNMAKVQPKLKEIQEKYKGDLAKLREEQMKLFKEEGVNPTGNCLSLIIQIPFLYAIYAAIIMMSKNGASAINKLLYIPFLRYPTSYHYNLNMFFINVGKDAFNFKIGDYHIIPYIILAILVGLSQYLVTKVSLPNTSSEVSKEDLSLELQESKGGDKKALEADPMAMGNAISKQMLYIMPIFIFIISLGVLSPIPAALSIYWFVQSMFIYVQSLILLKRN